MMRPPLGMVRFDRERSYEEDPCVACIGCDNCMCDVCLPQHHSIGCPLAAAVLATQATIEAVK